jgi:hypothetical protein
MKVALNTKNQSINRMVVGITTTCAISVYHCISDGSRDELVDQYEYPFLKFPFYVDCFLSSFTDKTFTGHDYKQHIGCLMKKTGPGHTLPEHIGSPWLSGECPCCLSDMLSIPHRGRRGSDRMVVAPGFVNYKKECTRLAAASDKVYQLLAHGQWFSPASSTTKTGRYDIAEILLKVALNTINQILNQIFFKHYTI